jgi:hypothetical protein
MNLNLQTRLITLLFILFTAQTVSAQINTEKYRKYYSDETGFMFNLLTTFSLKAGNTEYNAYKGSARVDYNGKKFDTFLVGTFEYKDTDEKKLENQGFLHLRGINHLSKRTTWEVFIQSQYDEFIDLNSRNLAGSGIKYRLIQHVSKKDTSNTLDANISTGLMYEMENYNLDMERVDRDNWRSTNFISIDWLIKEKLNLTGVLYYQPALKNLKDFRVAAEAGLEFAIAKSVQFIFQINYRYNNIPVTDVKKFDLSVENGIRIELK